MPPKINLEPYKNKILTWIDDNISYEMILSKIYEFWGIKCTSRTFMHQLASWNILHYKKTGSLIVERIKSCISVFFLDNYNDSEILQALSTEGISLSR